MAKVMVIGESTGKNDPKEGYPFTGETGDYFKKCLQESGLNFDDIYFSCTVTCKSLNAVEIKKYSDKLDQEITTVQPKIIVPAGNVALKRIMGFEGIMRCRGNKYHSDKYQTDVMPIIHPSAMLRDKRVSGGSYETKTIVDLKKILAEATGTATAIDYSNYVVCSDLKTIESIFNRMSELTCFSFDIETTGLRYWEDMILGHGFSWKEGTGVYIPILGQYKAPLWNANELHRIEDGLRNLYASKARKIAQNGSFDCKFIQSKIGPVSNFYADIMLMHHLIDENSRHGLKPMTKKYVPELGGYESELWAYTSEDKPDFSLVPTTTLGKYCCVDSDVTLRLFTLFSGELEKIGLTDFFYTLVMPLRYELTKMEFSGIRVDFKECDRLKTVYETQLIEQEKFIYGLLGECNLGSPKQLRDALFTKLGLAPTKRTKKGNPSTDEESLKTLEGSHPVVTKLLEHRHTSKIYSSFFKSSEKTSSLKDIADSNQRVHTSFKVHGTVTGRLSSKNPNLQNVSADPADGIRRLFIPAEGCKLVISDYSQVELRILAQYCGDPTMLEAFRVNEDIHTKTASQLNHIPYAQLETWLNGINEDEKNKAKKMRAQAKTINFAICYGAGAKKLAGSLGIKEDEAKSFLANYFNTFPKIQEFKNKVYQIVQIKHQLSSLFGRIRRLPDAALPETNDDFKKRKYEALRQSVNFLIQGTASECLSMSTVRIGKALNVLGLKTRLLLSVHDELCLESPPDEVDTVRKLVKDIMESVSPLITVPLVADVKVCDSWAEK